MTYGVYGPQIKAQLFRMGIECDVKRREETGQNEFGNTTDVYVSDRTVIATKTYPNRNTTVENHAGDRQRDNPVFLVPKGPNQPIPPRPEEVLNYDGTDFEVNSHTEYDTHVEFFGSKIIHDEAGI